MQQKYGETYQLANVIISGTHTHSTPGGFMMHLLYDMSTFGFVPETYNALVSGIYKVSWLDNWKKFIIFIVNFSFSECEATNISNGAKQRTF